MSKTDKSSEDPVAAGVTTLRHGAVTITLPANLKPSERAGKMSPDEVLHTPKAPLGIGLVCAQTADSMEKANDKFSAPASITPVILRSAGERAEEVDGVILDIEVILQTMKQANLLFDADAWD